MRVPLRLAESCARADRAIGARAWPALRTDPGRAVRPLDGSPAPAGEHPSALAGAQHPTYSGSAVHALARVLLTTHRLGGC